MKKKKKNLLFSCIPNENVLELNFKMIYAYNWILSIYKYTIYT